LVEIICFTCFNCIRRGGWSWRGWRSIFGVTRRSNTLDVFCWSLIIFLHCNIAHPYICSYIHFWSGYLIDRTRKRLRCKIIRYLTQHDYSFTSYIILFEKIIFSTEFWWMSCNLSLSLPVWNLQRFVNFFHNWIIIMIQIKIWNNAQQKKSNGYSAEN